VKTSVRSVLAVVSGQTQCTASCIINFTRSYGAEVQTQCGLQVHVVPREHAQERIGEGRALGAAAMASCG